MHHEEKMLLNLKSLLLPGGAGAILAILFPIPTTAVFLVVAALFAWMVSWMAGVAVSFYRRDFSWGKCIGGLLRRIVAYSVLGLTGAALTFLLGALIVEAPQITVEAARRIIWSPVCVISSMVGFAETISALRSASRLLPAGEEGRQIRKWLKPFTLLVQEIGDRTIETHQNMMRNAAIEKPSGEKSS